MVSSRLRRSEQISNNPRFLSKSWWKKLFCRDRTGQTADGGKRKAAAPVPTTYTRFRRVFDKHDANEPPTPVDPDQDLVLFDSEYSEIKCREMSCRQLFYSDLALYQHSRMEHAESFVLTRCCNRQFYTMGMIAFHASFDHDGQFVCLRCREYFEPNLLDDHLAKHGARQNVQRVYCVTCGDDFATDTECSDHIELEHKIKGVDIPYEQIRLPLVTRRAHEDAKQAGLPSSSTAEGRSRDSQKRNPWRGWQLCDRNKSVEETNEPLVVPCFNTTYSSAAIFSMLWNR